MYEHLNKPFVMNCWKHHFRQVKAWLGEHKHLPSLVEKFAVIGEAVMDLYHGKLGVEQICEEVAQQIGPKNAVEFKQWLGDEQYRMVTISDQSVWCLRACEVEGRHVHIHPGRYSPGTLRVKANQLKTVLMTLAVAQSKNWSPLEVGVVNRARAFLGMKPFEGEIPAGIKELLQTLITLK